jgi:membrane protein DedA with SNARE-associated domain
MRYVVIASVVLLGALGVPVPVPLAGMLVGAGVFAARGQLCVALLTALAALGATCGDLLGYLAGRCGARCYARYRGRLEADAAAARRGIYGPLARLVSLRAVQQALAWANGRLERGGSMAALIVLTRTALSAFGPVVNVLSGVRRYSLMRVLVLDALGELIWAGASVGAGFVAGMHGGMAQQVITHPIILVGGTLLGVLPMVVTRRRPRPAPAPAPVAARRTAS